ncbi:radical SAM protein [Candidatus Omnitrophota bacterium]
MLKKILRKIYYQSPASLSFLGYAFPCRNVVFEVIYSCNLSCEMCSYIAEMKYTEPRGSDFKLLDKSEIISLLREFPKGSNFNFTGGEPLLKEGILDILEEAVKRHKVSLSTNGTLFTDEIAEKLVRWGVQLIGFSLDGPKEIHNEIRRDPQAYDKLVDAINKVNEKKKGSEYPRLNLNGVILKKNFRLLYKNIELAKQLGFSSHTFQVCDPSWDRSAWRLSDKINAKEKMIEKVEPIDRKELKKALEHLVDVAKRLDININFVPALSIKEIVDYYDNRFDLNKWHCLNPWSTMRISPYGDVFPCLNFSIGNIRDKKPSELWNGPNYRRFRRALGRTVIFDSCVGCCKMERKAGFRL